MKAIKRTVAALLATLMLATSTSFTLAAEADVDDLAIAKVNAAGIMTGTDKGFEPSKSLTRAEAAAIIVRMKGISEATVKAAAGTTNFDDVAASHWAAGYINQASNLGIVKGVSATSFAPDKEVTVQEMVTMAVRALGAGTLVDSEGMWPTNYINFAAEEGLLDGVAGAYASVSTRLDAARVVANSLEANMWVKAEADTNSKITYKISGNTILNDVLKIDYQKGMTIDTIDTKDRHITLETLTAAQWTAKDAKDYTSTASLSDYDVLENVNLAALRSGDEVDVWFKTKTKEVVGVWAAENTKQTKVTFTSIVKDDLANNKITLLVNGSEKKYNVNASIAATDFTYNQGAYTSYANKEDVFGTATIVGNEIVKFYFEEYTDFAVVKEIKKDKTYYEANVDGANATYKFDFDEDTTDEYVISKDGKEVKALEEGDAIEFYTDGNNKYVVNVLTNSVEGKVESISASYIKIDGKKYNLAKTFAVSNVDTKDEITAWLNDKDEVVMAKVEEESMDSTLGVITSARAKTDDYGSKVYEFKVTGFDGVQSDVLALDKVKSVDKLGYAFFGGSTEPADDAAKKSLVDTYFNTAANLTALLGKPVRYNISSNKLILTEADKAGTITSAYTEKKIVVANSQTVKQDYNKVGTYKVTEDTEFYLVENGDESYQRKITKVEYDDLADNQAVSGYAIDVDKNDNKVRYFVLTGSVARSTDENYAIVKSIGSSTEDNEVILELFTVDGVKEIAADSAKVTAASLAAGSVIKYNKGDKITDITSVASQKYTGKVISYNDDNIKYTTDDTNASFVDCEEDILVLTYEVVSSTPDYTTLAETSKLPETGSLDTTPKMDGAKACTLFYKVDGTNNIVYAIIYEK